MPLISFDIPNDLLIAISNKAQVDGAEFTDTAIDLIRSGLSAPDKKGPDTEEVARLVSLMISRANVYTRGSLFTTQDLLKEEEWNSFQTLSRKLAGRGFSKAVKEGEVDSVVNTGKKTLQNKIIYRRD
jgi:hypothetical protein